MSSEIALFVGVGYALLTFFYVCMGTLAAQGRTTMIAIAFVLGAWVVAVPLAYIFAFVWKLTEGLVGLWLGLIAGYAVVSTVAIIATCRSNWPKIAAEARKRAEQTATSPRGATTDTDDELTKDRQLQNPVE